MCVLQERRGAVANLYCIVPPQVFNERTNHSPCSCVASTGRLQFLGGARQALAVDARRVRKDERGP